MGFILAKRIRSITVLAIYKLLGFAPCVGYGPMMVLLWLLKGTYTALSISLEGCTLFRSILCTKMGLTFISFSRVRSQDRKRQDGNRFLDLP